MKWGEYSSDVHFILQRTALNDSPNGKNGAASVVSPSSNNNKNSSSRPTKTSVDPLHGFTPPSNGSSTAPSLSSPPSAKDLKKSLTFSGGRPAAADSPQPSGQLERRPNVGVVRGGPQQTHQVKGFFLALKRAASIFLFILRSRWKWSKERALRRGKMGLKSRSSLRAVRLKCHLSTNSS